MKETNVPPPLGRLYSAGQVGLAALLGAPAAGGWFMSRNERQLARPRNSRWWLWGGIVGTALLIVISFLLPVHFPRTGLAVGYVVAFYNAAKQLQGQAFQTHREAGGAIGSWWKVVGISLVFLLLSVVMIFAVALLLPESVTARFMPADVLPDQP